MNQREVAIASAIQDGKSTVEILPYDTAYEEQLKKNGKSARKLFGKLSKYPGFIHYFDPVEDTSFYVYYYAAFKKIDTIQYKGKKFGKFKATK